MDDRVETLLEKRARLLRETAEVSVEIDRRNGTITGVPHYSVIEQRAHELGEQLSVMVQQRQMNEIVALETTRAKCPSCRTTCELQPDSRTVTSIDGPVELQELKGHCPCCRRDFFPDAEPTRF